MYLQKVPVTRKNFFWRLQGQRRKLKDPDPYPDWLVRGMDPRIRIRTKISWIRNTTLKQAVMRYLCCRTGPSPLKLMVVGSGSSQWRISCCPVESVSPACQWVSFNCIPSLFIHNVFCKYFPHLGNLMNLSRFPHVNKFFPEIYRTLENMGEVLALWSKPLRKRKF